jgi:predicted NBD/HSP70 family sugar kinase
MPLELPATGRDTIRAQNRHAVLTAIHRKGQVSRIDLANDLNLSPAALTDITSELIAQGLVFEARPGLSSSVGRKPILLEINYDHAYIIGVKVSNATVTTALTNLGAQVLAWRSDAVAEITPGAIASLIDKAIKKLLRESGIARERVGGLGVGLPGIVEVESGTYGYSALFGWRDVPLKHLLEEKLELPTFIDNDVNALATAEAWFGSGQGHDHFLVVTLGLGVGLGIVIGGQVYRGPKGGAGEFGHITLEPKGAKCSCGKQGCLEAYLADGALVREALASVPKFTRKHSLHDLTEMARAGDKKVLALYQNAGERLGTALSTLVNIFAPSLIILSGEGMRAAPFLLTATKQALQEGSFGGLAKGLELKVDTWGDEAWARGAAGLAASRHLHDMAAMTGGESQLKRT